MTSSVSLEDCRQYLMGGSVGASSPFTVARALGSEIWDTNGKRYIDCTAQAWSLSVGHSHPRIVKAVSDHLKNYGHIRTSFDTEPKLQLAQKLIDIAPPGMRKVSFCLSGSEAIEGAIKLALRNRHVKESQRIITLEEGFHGRTFATMAASWPHPKNPFSYWMSQPIDKVKSAYCYRCPLDKEIETCKYACMELFDNVPQSAAAILMEPFPGNGGMIKFPPEYLQRVRDRATEKGMLLILDEIQTGMGRLGDKWFACSKQQVVPDIMVIGKGLGGGFPLFAILSGEKIVNGFQAGDHSFTFAHFSPSMVAALETIAIIEEEDLLKHVTKLGHLITSRLLGMKEKYDFIGDIRGEGLMIGIELVRPEGFREPAWSLAHSVIQRCMAKGVIFGESKYAGLGNIIKIKPPLNISEDLVFDSLAVLEEVFQQVVPY